MALSIERDAKPLIISGRYLEQHIVASKDPAAEVKKMGMQLDPERLKAILDGRAHIRGDTDVGLTYEENA